MRRKTNIAFILGCIVLTPLLFSGGLQLFQKYTKDLARQRLETNELITISLPLHNVKWMEDGREIMVNGKMFDIKSYCEKEGNLIAIGIYDEKETTVMELLNNFNNKEKNNFIIQLLLFTQSFVAVIYFLNNSVNAASFLKHSYFLVLKKISPFLQQFYPPPRCFYNS